MLASIGVIDTGSITFSHWGWIKRLTCNNGAGGCEKVLNSAWGFILGQPLSLFGFLAYSAILTGGIISFVLSNKNSISIIKWNQRFLFLVSCAMAVFSLLLMNLLIFKIKIFCFFCMLSAILSITLLFINSIMLPREEYDQLIFVTVLMSLTLGTIGLLWVFSADFGQKNFAIEPIGKPPIVRSVSDPSKISLARFLTNSGTKMYSMYWCPHCHEQKELFGKEASSNLNIIECASDGKNSKKDICKENKVNRFPSWEIKNDADSLTDSGVKSLNELADLSGYNKTFPF
uniref:Vitamin K epoxide reductase domain-containing protein n=1 Tax=Paulinella chromatophora TaxID=39717 RepID=B1X458_PAUCH|nr:hypothetical protein PCC_0285 [Paulinella chromatophora]ACB42727.1 hypothetical protein PCC_0285 [Paulinella chromatophora]